MTVGMQKQTQGDPSPSLGLDRLPAPAGKSKTVRSIGELITPQNELGEPFGEMRFQRIPGAYYCSKQGTRIVYGLKILNPPSALVELIEEVNHATPKQVFFFDNSFLLNNEHSIPANFTDNRSWPTVIPIFLDPTRAAPEIVAHELMHSWIEFFAGLEDGREYFGQSNRSVATVVNFIQSMVLDCTVLWQLRKRGGFKLDSFRHDIMANARENVIPLKSGMMHRTPLGQIVAALALAVPTAYPDLYFLSTGEKRELQGLWSALWKCEPTIACTADKIASALCENGYETESGIRGSIDRSLAASFDFLCYPFKPDKDLVWKTVRLALVDKMPDFMPGCPVDIKHEVLRDSIRTRRHILHSEHTPGGNAIVRYSSQEGAYSALGLPKITGPRQGGPTDLFIFEAGSTAAEMNTLQSSDSTPPFPHPSIYSDSYLQCPNPAPQLGLSLKEGNMFYCPQIGRFLAKDMIMRPGANPYVFVNNCPLEYVDPTGLWEQGGHYYTGYLVSRLAASRLGGSVINPEALAYYAQLPDQIQYLEATPEAIRWYGQGIAVAAGSGASGGIGSNQTAAELEANRWTYDIFEILHSLHGGDAQAVFERRDCLKNFLQNLVLKGAPDWQIGFTIHALGDAFSHTFQDEKGLHAFGWSLGHGPENLAGITPDSIGLHHSAFSGYVDTLYEALTGHKASFASDSLGQIKNAGLKAGLANIQNWAKGNKITEQSMRAESEAMRQYAISQGLSDEFNPLGPQKTFEKKYATPSKAEVRMYLDAVKKACTGEMKMCDTTPSKQFNPGPGK